MFGSSKKSRIFASQFRKMVCPDGGIGRRAGLKHQWIHFHPGSTPGLGTRKRGTRVSLFFFVSKVKFFVSRVAVAHVSEHRKIWITVNFRWERFENILSLWYGTA